MCSDQAPRQEREGREPHTAEEFSLKPLKAEVYFFAVIERIRRAVATFGKHDVAGFAVCSTSGTVLLGASVSGPVALTGGGARGRLWSQLRADVLGRPVYIPRFAEPAVGMAILARAGTESVTDTAARMVHVGERFEPDRNRAERLADNFDSLTQELVKRGCISTGLANRAKLA